MQKKRPCPMCRKPVSWKDNPWKPFCSERCKMTDLGFWAMGEYKVAGEKVSRETMAGEGEDDEDKKQKTKSKKQDKEKDTK